MQRRNLSNLSRLRQTLRRLLQNLERSLAEVFGRSPLVKGNVYELARKCGKPNCVCTRGELHRSMVLTWSEGGKSRLVSIRPDRLGELKEVTEISREIVTVLDQIEKLRREEP
jgi:hypothetical protein